MEAKYCEEHPRFENTGRLSYLIGPGPAPLATPDKGYNGLSKSQSFRLSKRKPTHPLSPLAEGKAVVLTMDVGAHNPGIRRVSPPRPTPVVLTPGPIFGAPPGAILVSVIGKGSAVVYPFRRPETALAELVSAGMPSRLAHALMADCRRLMQRI